ncbi:DMT family transporter [Myxococcus sp. K15C18031901]|uniref:DMT family transporter n=1 Tax=Myxococcus dinghuensis TaxID=2906761 RepID=UPI0020A6F5A4|nr:DMT family transporter [Myxococcus dinghuensis]MCP3103103.1 DMT family transporter [Myxococcus dinghuensis]
MTPAAPSTVVKPASSLKVVFAYCACFILWGSTWAVIKVGLQDLPPLRFLGLRLLVAGLALLPFVRATGWVDARTGWRIAALGLLQLAAPFALLFIAQQWIPSSWAALLFSTFPMWLLLIGRVMMPDQPLTPGKLVAAGLGVAGVMVLQRSGLEGLQVSGKVLLAVGLTLAAVCILALANVLAKQHMAHVPAPVLVLGQALTSALPMLVCSFLLEADQPTNWTPRAVGAIAYLAVFGTACTYLCLYWLLPRISLTALGAMALLDTLVAVVLGVLFLDEPFTLSLVVGGALILGGAALANVLPSGTATSRPREETSA